MYVRARPFTKEMYLARRWERHDPPRLRRADPDALFERMSALMAAGYAQQLGAERKSGA